MITESDRLSEALEAAAQLWPEIRHEKTALVRRILDLGIDQLVTDAREKAQARLVAIDTVAGSLREVWPADWREEIQAQWPA